MPSLRETIRGHLPGLAPGSMVDLRSLFKDPGAVTPPPTVYQRIPMDQPIDVAKVMEWIIHNLFKSAAELSVESWRALFQFEETYGRPGIIRYDWAQRAFLVLYVVSKVDMIEFTKESHLKFNVYFLSLVEALEKIVTGVRGAAFASAQVVRKGKGFLKSPRIVFAISKCLNKVFMDHELLKEVNDEKIRSIVEGMKILLVDDLSYLRGVTVNDGVILNLAKLNVIPENTLKYKAQFLTLLVHEAAHFIVRTFVNDFGFTSPLKYGDTGEKLTDPIIGSKGLEIGRYIELLLFGMQPNWSRSSQIAAYLFRRRAHQNSQHLPLFGLIERRLLLTERAQPSISMAGDFSDSLPSVETIGC